MWLRRSWLLGWTVALLLGFSGCGTPAHVRWQAGPLAAGDAATVVGVADFDAARLAVGIFAETNRVRREFGLRALRPYPGLRAAADLQAEVNSLTGIASHQNPLRDQERAWDRVKAAGIPAQAVWENVLSRPLRYSGNGVATRVGLGENRERVQIDASTGEELSWPTYGELAERIVAQWMDSPPHRANILNPEPTRMACGVGLSRTPLGSELVQAVQVFMVPVSTK